MKRSEMIEIMANTFRGSRENIDWSKGARSANKQQMEYILKAIEEAGMPPPENRNKYSTIPTVTPTGNYDYGYVREWEQEND